MTVSADRVLDAGFGPGLRREPAFIVLRVVEPADA